MDSAQTTGAIMLILSTANVLSWILASQGVGDALARWLGELSGGPTIFLLLTIALLVVMGAAMEGCPALILCAPLLLPIGRRLGLIPLHDGIVLVVAMGVGVFSPPIGVGLYIARAICRARIEETVREYLPYPVVLLAAVIVIAFVPWFTLVPPWTLHLSSQIGPPPVAPRRCRGGLDVVLGAWREGPRRRRMWHGTRLPATRRCSIGPGGGGSRGLVPGTAVSWEARAVGPRPSGVARDVRTARREP